jgi:hypothetical protein
MRCPSCGEEDIATVEPGCLDEEGERRTFAVCRNCDYGINEHTEGECNCEKS